MSANDWVMFAATLGAGVLAALATFLAVWLTNKKTAENYEKELKHQREARELVRKEKAMVIIKPRMFRNTFGGILDMIIMRGSLERVLLFSGNDGFDFLNHTTTKEDGKQYSPIWDFMFIENDSLNDIHSVKFTTHSKLETATNAITEYTTNNFVALLRSKESIAIRLKNLEQWEKTNEANEFTFEANIEYLTAAKQQISYRYEVKIKNYKTEVLKDDYDISDDITLISDNKTTVYRNLQDDIATLDRSAYTWEKIGAAQMRGLSYNLQPARANSSDIDTLIDIVKRLFNGFQNPFAAPNSENTLEESTETTVTEENIK